MPFYGTLPGIFTIKPERSLFLYSSTYIWAKVLAHMEQKLTDTIVTTWFDDTEVLELTDQKLVLYSPTVFRKVMIVSRCETYIKDALKELFDMDLELVVLDDTEIEAYRSSKKKPRFIEFNPQFTFDNFIVGNSNKFANAAAVAVAEKPADSYNPLFIYGPSGVGKTHLLYAIANEIHSTTRTTTSSTSRATSLQMSSSTPCAKAKTTSSVSNTAARTSFSSTIFSSSPARTPRRRNFHTFNNLYESHKQIVLTSDRPPNEMVRLEDRLRTRFEWGLLADIQPPDYETRMAIIKNKAVNLGFDLPDDVCNYIAENITNNVRQIEGTVKKIKAFKELNGMVLDVPNVARAIKDMFKGKTENLPTPSLIISEVCQYYGIEEQVLRSTLKNKNTAEARQVAMYLIRTMTNLSLPEIGREFDRDHTTVMHGLKKVEQTLQNSASPLNDTIRDITANVNNKL